MREIAPIASLGRIWVRPVVRPQFRDISSTTSQAGVLPADPGFSLLSAFRKTAPYGQPEFGDNDCEILAEHCLEPHDDSSPTHSRHAVGLLGAT